MLQLILGVVLIVSAVGAVVAGSSPGWLVGVLSGIAVLGVRRDGRAARLEE